MNDLGPLGELETWIEEARGRGLSQPASVASIAAASSAATTTPGG